MSLSITDDIFIRHVLAFRLMQEGVQGPARTVDA
jgi:hypothetical protein